MSHDAEVHVKKGGLLEQKFVLQLQATPFANHFYRSLWDFSPSIVVIRVLGTSLYSVLRGHASPVVHMAVKS